MGSETDTPDQRWLGRYKIRATLGEGASATVYLADDDVLEREVALKVIHPHLMQKPAVVERFYREARAAVRLDHPNIVRVYDVGEIDDRHVIVMRYLQGRPLSRIMADHGALPWKVALNVVHQVADALDYAHERGVVHRDVKPSNIVIDNTGRVILTDFGLVKLVEASSVTGTGSGLGTPPYMPPEVWRDVPVTPAADVYALACVFYEMITGDVLFAAATPAAVMAKHLMKPPQFPAIWPPGVVPGMERVLGRALAKCPGERYGRAGDFAAALADPRASPAVEKTEPDPGSLKLAYLWRFLRSDWVWVSGGVVLLTAIVAVMIGVLLSSLGSAEGGGEDVVSLPVESPTATPFPISTPTRVPPTLVRATSTPFPVQPPVAAPSGEQIHVVQPGENLYRIALQYGMSYPDLAAYNNITNPHTTHVGMEIRIPPSGMGSTPQPSGGTVHIVQPGENLFHIALRYNMSYRYLADYNNISNPNSVYVGQRIRIP